MAIKERKQITGTPEQINAYAGHEGQIVWDKENKTFVGMSGTAGTNYPLATKEYVDNEVANAKPTGDYATNAQLTEGLAGKEDKGTCLPKSGGTLLGGGVKLLSSDGLGTAQILISNPGDTYAGVDLVSEISGWDNGAILSLRTNDSVNEKGSFHLRTGKSPNVLFLRGFSDGRLLWKDNEIVRTGVGNRMSFSPGASGATYKAPVTGKCIVTGSISDSIGVNAGNVEVINASTMDQMSAGTLPNKGWMRVQVNVRKGDTVNIHYYNFKKESAYWVEL